MALDLPLPYQVLTHAHWTLGHNKMSKSRGNVVNAFFAIERFGVDTIRYYLAYDGGLKDDASYENSYIIERYNKGLHGGLGNLLSRVVRGKKWSVRRAAERGEIDEGDPIVVAQCNRLLETPDKVAEIMVNLDPGAALREIMDGIFKVRIPYLLKRSVNNFSSDFKLLTALQTNQFMQNAAPWYADEERAHKIIFVCAESIRIYGILLQPYMPSKMKDLLDQLGVDPAKRCFANTKFGSDSTYGTPMVPTGRGLEGVLFPPLHSAF